MGDRERATLRILTLLRENGRFKRGDVIEEVEDVSPDVVQDVCQSLEDGDLLTRDKPRSTVWRPGPLAEDLLDLTEKARKNARD